jgi:hypothetical protein
VDIGAIRLKVAARLGAVAGLTVYRVAPAKPVLPCAIVRPGPIDLHSTFDEGMGNVKLAVQLLVDLTSWEDAQDALDVFISSGSVVDALEADTADDGISVLMSTVDPQGQVQYGPLQVGTVTFHGDVLE